MTTFKIKTGVLALAFSYGASFGFTAIAEDGANQMEGYKALTEAYLKPTGDWLQMNERYEPGGDQPKYWLGSFSKGPGGSVIIDVNLVLGNDACFKLAHLVYYFDKAEGKIQRAAFLANGQTGSSSIAYNPDGSYVAILEVTTPEGKRTMKDTETFEGPDTRATTAHFLDPETGEWVYDDTTYWKRAGEDFKNPC